MEFLQRYVTFVHFPPLSPLAPSILAKQGFVYNNKLRVLECVGCAFRSINLSCTIDALVRQHHDYNSECEFILNYLLYILTLSETEKRPVQRGKTPAHLLVNEKYKTPVLRELSLADVCIPIETRQKMAVFGLYRAIYTEKQPATIADSRKFTNLTLLNNTHAWAHIKCAFCSFEELLCVKPTIVSKQCFSVEAVHIAHIEQRATSCLGVCSKFHYCRVRRPSLAWLSFLYNFEMPVSLTYKNILAAFNNDMYIEVQQLPMILEYLQKKLVDCLNNQPAAAVADGSLSLLNCATDSQDLLKIKKLIDPAAPPPPPDITTPRHPHFSIYETRLASFTTWSFHVVQNPALLAQAGFFYSGLHDFTECFFCGGGLKNWSFDDVPAEVHLQWYPFCQYARLINGPASAIQQITTKHQRKTQSTHTHRKYLALFFKCLKLIPEMPCTSSSLEQKVLDAYANNALAKRLVQSQLVSQEVMRAAIEGLSFCSLFDETTLCEIVLNLQRVCSETERQERTLSHFFVVNFPPTITNIGVQTLFFTLFSVRVTVRILRAQQNVTCFIFCNNSATAITDRMLRYFASLLKKSRTHMSLFGLINFYLKNIFNFKLTKMHLFVAPTGPI